MKRFNYLSSSHEMRAGNIFEAVRVLDFSSRTQVAFLVFSMAALISSGLSLWQTAEVRQAKLRFEIARVRMEDASQRLRRTAPIMQTLDSLQLVAEQVADVRGRTSERLQMLADLGDSLSTRVWLVSLHEDDDGILLLRGRAQNVADLGSVLGDLRRQRALDAPQLQKVHSIDAGDQSLVEFDIAMKERK